MYSTMTRENFGGESRRHRISLSRVVWGFISSDPHPTGGALRSRLLISYSRCVHGGEPPGDGDGSGEPCLSGDRRRSRWAVGRGMQIEVEMSGMGTSTSGYPARSNGIDEGRFK